VVEMSHSSRPLEAPVARSPIRPSPPTKRVGDWEVSGRRSLAHLRLADLSALAKVHVRTQLTGGEGMEVPFGRAQRDGPGHLVVSQGPHEWLVLGPSGGQRAIVGELGDNGRDLFTTVTDLTHGFALMRLTGFEARAVLSKVCPVDLSERTAPNGHCFRTSLAGLVVGVVRDDVNGQLSYLCYCERSSGQYLFDIILDAGQEFAADVDGYPDDEI
jgi:heterotetrameric sarcosine oxidase gamma subunit